MSWYRASSLMCFLWSIAFTILPGLTNRLFGKDYLASPHAEDWTRLFGLSVFVIAFFLNEAHRSSVPELRRSVARGALLFFASCAALMTYWQLIPDGHWNRLDIANVLLLYIVSYGMFTKSGRSPSR